jgi:phosphatidylglycerol lysyltransferase-like protein
LCRQRSLAERTARTGLDGAVSPDRRFRIEPIGDVFDRFLPSRHCPRALASQACRVVDCGYPALADKRSAVHSRIRLSSFNSGLDDIRTFDLAPERFSRAIFDLGTFNLAQIRRNGVAAVFDAEGRLEAFATWLPYKQAKGRSLDLMRTHSDAKGVMDFLIVESIDRFKSMVPATAGNARLR